MRKNAHPEKELQTKINQWCREHLPQPHMFFSVDRSKATGKFTHAREKAAGHVAGTPDTVLLFPGLPAITIELKADGKKPEAGGSQEKVGARIQESGHLWGWCDSVVGYCDLVAGFGVPVAAYARVRAEGHDRVLLAAAIRREEAKTGVPAKARGYRAVKAPKPSAARIRAVEAVRRRVRF